MKPGDNLEWALWYNATEHPVDPISTCRDTIEEMMDVSCKKHNLTHGKVTFEILKPGEDRVPEVPNWLEQQKGSMPRLIVVHSVAEEIIKSNTGILGDLDKKDIARLRLATRRIHKQYHPKAEELSDQECDYIIDQMGIEVVMEQLRSSTVQ